MSRYIVDISSGGPSRHDISKRSSIEGKIEKYRSISPIYRLWINISVSKSVKVATSRKMEKKKIFFADISADIGDILTDIFVFFLSNG